MTIATIPHAGMTGQPQAPDPHLLVRDALEVDATRAEARAEVARVLCQATGETFKICEGWAELTMQAVELHGVTWRGGCQ